MPPYVSFAPSSPIKACPWALGRARVRAMSQVQGISVIEPTQGPATGYIAFVHGIMGSGTNWRAFARKLIAQTPGQGALLVDLALHGALRDNGPLVPNTVEATAQDLAARLALGGWPLDALAGHSFGGKVVSLAAKAMASDRARSLWILDSPPGPRVEGQGSASTLRVLASLSRLPLVHESRAAFVQALEAQGIERSVAQWLATNLRAIETGGFRFALDLVAIEAVLEDFFNQDTWPTIDALGQDPNWGVEVIYGGRSSVFVPQELEALQARAARGQLRARCIEKAGHWLHVDAPAELLELMGGAQKLF